MRDKLIQAYPGVDTQKVWLVVQEHLPRLKHLITQVLIVVEG